MHVIIIVIHLITTDCIFMFIKRLFLFSGVLIVLHSSSDELFEKARIKKLEISNVSKKNK